MTFHGLHCYFDVDPFLWGEEAFVDSPKLPWKKSRKTASLNLEFPGVRKWAHELVLSENCEQNHTFPQLLAQGQFVSMHYGILQAGQESVTDTLQKLNCLCPEQESGEERGWVVEQVWNQNPCFVFHPMIVTSCHSHTVPIINDRFRFLNHLWWWAPEG